MAMDLTAWLKQRKGDARRERTQLARNYAQSRSAVYRALSNVAHDFSICPDRACRRLRRCAGGPLFPCRDVLRPLHNEIEERLMIEDAYFTTEEWRAAAKRGGKV